MKLIVAILIVALIILCGWKFFLGYMSGIAFAVAYYEYWQGQ